ncbi:hypothetical protein GQ600_26570 [Phytophthora cactorum]|nr:hypothetical protein GQ600_26570 [Phytophthora cactorum]
MVAEIEAIDHANQSGPYKREAVSNQDPNCDNDHLNNLLPAAEHERIHTFLNLQLHSLLCNHREKYLEGRAGSAARAIKDILAAVQFSSATHTFQEQRRHIQEQKLSYNTVANISTPSPSASSTQLPQSHRYHVQSRESGGIYPVGIVIVFFENLRGLAEDEGVPSRYADVMDEAIDRCDIVLKGSELRGES